ncbi:MAG: hypothetical protein Q4C37_05215 [Bacteroidales bacterium]|nr:hypothetical protein [Bacteroidales bacterium]
MEESKYLKLAKEYSIKQWGFDIVLPAGEEDGWHYFSCTRLNRPHYGSLPSAIRINSKGEVESLEGYIMRSKVSRMAYKLRDMKNVPN